MEERGALVKPALSHELLSMVQTRGLDFQPDFPLDICVVYLTLLWKKIIGSYAVLMAHI